MFHRNLQRSYNAVLVCVTCFPLAQLKKAAEDLNDALATKEEIAQRCHELDMQVQTCLQAYYRTALAQCVILSYLQRRLITQVQVNTGSASTAATLSSLADVCVVNVLIWWSVSVCCCRCGDLSSSALLLKAYLVQEERDRLRLECVDLEERVNVFLFFCSHPLLFLHLEVAVCLITSLISVQGL